MEITDAAAREYEEMFGSNGFGLEQNDPEMAQIFENFAFDEVPGACTLDKQTRLIVTLASMVACGAHEAFRIMLGGALDDADGITAVQAKEIVYHAAAYAGFSIVYPFIGIANEVMEARGIELPLPAQGTTDPANRLEAGRKTQSDIFGKQNIDAMYERAPVGQMQFQTFLSGNCFGDYYTRGGLDVRQRELVTFAVIESIGGCEPQLKAHAAGNIAVGNTPEVLVGVVTALVPYLGYPRSLNALACVNEAASR